MDRLLFLLFSVISLTGFSQCDGLYTFSDEGETNLFIDTLSNPDNIWQIGTPDKPVFTSSLTFTGAIVTDTMNPYPVNDTSSFIITHVACEGAVDEGAFAISGAYYVNSDSLNDFGKIEFSPDNGISWVSLSEDTMMVGAETWPFGSSPLPLTGNSGAWQGFFIPLDQTPDFFGVALGDTTLFRFTFISDGTAEALDGLMFDELEIYDDIFWGVGDNQNLTITAYPNPFFDAINITGVDAGTAYSISNSCGAIVQQGILSGQSITGLENLAKGVYFLKFETEEGTLVNRIVK